MFYLQTKIGARVHWWTGRRWVPREDALARDIAIKGWRREENAVMAARRIRVTQPWREIEVCS